MGTLTAEPCRACGAPMTRLGGGIDVCLFHDGVQDQEVVGLPRSRTTQDTAYDKWIAEKWERETGANWKDMRLKK